MTSQPIDSAQKSQSRSTITIAASGTTSDAYNIGGRAVVKVNVPTVDAAYFTFLVRNSAYDSDYTALADSTGTAVRWPSSTTTTGGVEATFPWLSGYYDFKLVASAAQTSGAVTFYVSATGANPTPFDGSAVAAADFPSAFPRLATYTKAAIQTAPGAWTTANSPLTLFTVTGTVLMQVYGVVTTGFTSTGTTGTVEIGVTGNTACLLPQVTANGTNFPTGAVWTDGSPTLKAESLGDAFSAVLVANTNVIGTIATNNMTAGGIVLYCRWIPISAGATVTGN